MRAVFKLRCILMRRTIFVKMVGTCCHEYCQPPRPRSPELQKTQTTQNEPQTNFFSKLALVGIVPNQNFSLFIDNCLRNASWIRQNRSQGIDFVWSIWSNLLFCRINEKRGCLSKKIVYFENRPDTDGEEHFFCSPVLKFDIISET